MTVPAYACYVDIAANRIQTWLSRSPRLRYRRGASFALERLTSNASVQDVLRGDYEDFRINDQAGQVSGVVSLLIGTSPGDPAAEKAALARSQEVARAVIGHVQAELPFCPMTAHAGFGTDYLSAYQDMQNRRLQSGPLLDHPGILDESIVSHPCDLCGARLAETSLSPSKSGDPVVPFHLCQDCWTRTQEAGWNSSAQSNGLPRSQRRLYAALKARIDHLSGKPFPDDFGQLARRGQTDKDDAATQLCLIAADGNRIGSALDRIASSSAGSEMRKLAQTDVAAAIQDATETAVIQATLHTFVDPPIGALPGDTKTEPKSEWRTDPPIQLHLSAGDDVLVSVPATAGWCFAQHLLTEFTNQAKEALRGRASTAECDLSDESLAGFIERPISSRSGQNVAMSMSAGLVFHHASQPFADVVIRAEECLGKAKQLGQGVAPCIHFHDLTADGEEPIGDRQWAIVDLETAAPILNELAKTPASHRDRLLQDIRGATSPDASPQQQAEAQASFVRHATAMGHGAIKKIRELATTSEGDEILTVDRKYLDVARWWR